MQRDDIDRKLIWQLPQP